MPNWTSNSIRIAGVEADLRAFLEAVKSQGQILDFNRLIPMPELLKHSARGRRTIDGKKVSSWYVIDTGDRAHPDNDNFRCFTAKEEAALKKIGHTDWYSWAWANWGTKWNASHAEIAEDCAAQGYVQIRFDTAWTPPIRILEKMFQTFPKLSFVCTWENEGERQRYSIESDAVADDEQNP